MMYVDRAHSRPTALHRLAELTGFTGPSRGLRRRRRIRMVLSLVLAGLWSFCLMIMVAQLGVSRFVHHGRIPWWGGILVGFMLSMAFARFRRAVRSVRVNYLARRSALAGLVLIAGALSLWSAEPAAAQADDSAIGDCDVTVQVVALDGTLGPIVLLSGTSRIRPLDVDPDDVSAVVVDWNIAPGVDLDGRRWRVWAEIHGMRRTIAEKEAGAVDTGRYNVPVDELRTRPPGIIPVGGVFDGVCVEEEGYIRVLGGPFDNPVGLLASAGLVLTSAGLVLARRPVTADLWWFRTPNRVEVRVVDPATGRPVSGPLVRGGLYDAEVTLDMPPSVLSGLGAGQGVEVVAGSIGAGLGPSSASVGLRPGRTATRLRFQVPTEQRPLQLQVDLHAQGRVIESVQLREAIDPRNGRLHGDVSRGVGHVTYSLGALARESLAGAEPVDGTVMFHGSVARDLVETWVLSGQPGGRVVARHRILVSDLAAAADAYRQVLEQVSVSLGLHSLVPTGAAPGTPGSGTPGSGTPGLASPGPDPRVRTLAELAAAGAELRHRLIGPGTSDVPFGGRLAIAADIDAIDHLTVPLGGIYEGGALPSDTTTLCSTYEHDPDGCAGHGTEVVCPTLFWAMRHELVWPRNQADAVEQPPASLVKRLAGALASARTVATSDPSSLSDSSTSLVGNGPTRVLRLVSPELEAADADSSFSLGIAEVNGWQTATRGELLRLLHGPAAGCDVIYALTHGGVDNPEQRRTSSPHHPQRLHARGGRRSDRCPRAPWAAAGFADRPADRDRQRLRFGGDRAGARPTTSSQPGSASERRPSW